MGVIALAVFISMREIKVSPFERVALIEVSNKSYRKLYIMIQGTPTGGKENYQLNISWSKPKMKFSIKNLEKLTPLKLTMVTPFRDYQLR